MKIYFTCSTAEFNTHKKIYHQIRNLIISEKHILTKDWIPLLETRIQNNEDDVKDIKRIYKDCIESIKKADLVIIEDTVSNFSTGHQITIALQLRKPTLVLWNGKKHQLFKNMFIHGIESDILEVKNYELSQLDEIIKVFINKFTNSKSKNRFHLVLNQFERDYLDWAQFNFGESRTKLIRNALRHQIHNDKDYEKYLSSK